ncbi:MAG: hypothetical protein RMJ98_08660 [Myxococcales bacterium]|nr:hypothetical protein [Polyangiaceae bacterium]MDW8249359.1 hypothetical protein [Myxococcales bacterium]
MSSLVVSDLAASCVEYVQRSLGVELDYTSDTLPLLDHYLLQAARQAQQRPEALELIAQVAAAYFGETLSRRFDCWWSLPDCSVTTGLLRFRQVYLEISPYALVVAALGLPVPEDTPEVGFHVDPDDIEFLDAHLAALPPVPEEEFLRLSTRYDVLETIAEQLKARAVARNLGEVTFEDPDYEE